MLGILDRGLSALCIAGATLVVVLLLAGPGLIGAKGHVTLVTPPSPGAAKSAPSGAQNSAPSGAQVFASAGCSGCHTLSAAGATGSIGPNLDQLRPSAATVAATVRSGAGSMPSFAGKLSDAQITAVAGYVSSVAGH